MRHYRTRCGRGYGPALRSKNVHGDVKLRDRVFFSQWPTRYPRSGHRWYGQSAINLGRGDNQITVTASNGAGREASLGPLAYSVKTTVPRFTVNGPDGRPLNGTRQNNLFVESGTQSGGSVFWTISGSVQGALVGSDVVISLESERSGQAPTAPAQVTTDNQGNFRFDVEIANGAFWGGSLTLAATDVCMQRGESSSYAIQLDAVVLRSALSIPVTIRNLSRHKT